MEDESGHDHLRYGEQALAATKRISKVFRLFSWCSIPAYT